MAEAQKEPEVEALQQILTALKPLPAGLRSRVIASVQVLLGIQGPLSSTEAGTPPEKTEVPEGESGGRARTSSKDRLTSIGELVAAKGPRTNAQYITLFAYYRERYQGLTRFSRDDLRQLFADARKKPPENYARDFGETVKKGWIHEDGDNSYITSKGMEIAESGFEGPTRSKPRRARKAAQKGAGKK